MSRDMFFHVSVLTVSRHLYVSSWLVSRVSIVSSCLMSRDCVLTVCLSGIAKCLFCAETLAFLAEIRPLGLYLLAVCLVTVKRLFSGCCFYGRPAYSRREHSVLQL